MTIMTSSRNDMDITDRGARLRRIVLAFVLGAVAAIVAYVVTKGVVKPDTITNTGPGFANAPFQNAWKLIYFMTGLAGAVVFAATLAISTRLAKR